MATVILLLLLVPFATAQPWQLCGDRGNYRANSNYQANLRLLSSTLPKKAGSNTTLFGFAAGTAGNAPDTVYALALCRGDTSASACADCVATAFPDVQQLCAYSNEATMYYDPCMLSLSDRNILAGTVNGKVDIVMNVQNFTTSTDSIRLSLFTLLDCTARSAASSSRRFTTSRLDVSSVPTLYCLMQCTPDLTADECAACFQDFSQLTLQYLDGPQGGRLLGLRCDMRYEVYQFFHGEPMLRITNLAAAVPAMNNTTPGTLVTVHPQSQLPAAAPPPEAQTTVQEQYGSNARKSKLWIIAIVTPLLAILLCFIFFFVWMRRRRKGKANLREQAATNRLEDDALVWRLEEKGNSEFTLFDFSEIQDATGNFAEENRLGQGGFGPVYKGQLLDGLEVAVKRLASHSGQGFTEFKNEVELIAKLQHNNLVRLLGCCIQGAEKILVYEYLPNKSLDFFIFGRNRRTFLDWSKRRAIIEGIAQGLLYLHKHSRLRVIHRDLKASNILLDQDMNPKISDFGLAKIFSSNDTQGSTKRVVGTYGYMSPEYASEGIYSIKSDVFSFGVLLLEILSGQKNSGFHQYDDFLNLLGYRHACKDAKMEGRLGICDLPTDCVARIVSLTSPGDACRLAATAVALRAAADSDEVWESFLPEDCANILERCTDEPPVRCESETKKDFFFRLCNSPVLLDGGKLSFSLGRCSGAKKYMIPAKALCFGWSGYPYGGLVWSHNHPHSRFCEVAVLSHVCWLDVYGIFNTKHLSNGGRGYTAYLVYKVHWLHADASQNHNQEEAGFSSSSSSSSNDICSHECNHLVPHKHLRSPLWDWDWKLDGASSAAAPVDKAKKNPKRKPKPDGVSVRSDGRWMEQEINVELDEQCLHFQGKERDVSVEFRGLTGSHRCQVIVEGIEIKPSNASKPNFAG